LGKRNAVIAAVVAGVMFLTAGGALATRAASNQFANATITALGGDDPQAVLDAIADRVVKQLMGSSGPLAGASKDLTDKLGKAAGNKLDGIDTDALLDQVSSEVVAAGMGKLDGISTDAIVEQVTNALIAGAMAEIKGIDLQALATSTLDGAVEDLLANVDLEKIIQEQLDKIDVEKIVADVVKDQLGSSGPGGLLGMLLR
jgi:hypothetical protein